jgi:hypothetical protein
MNTLGAPKLYILFIISIGIKGIDYFIVVLLEHKTSKLRKKARVKNLFLNPIFSFLLMGNSREK